MTSTATQLPVTTSSPATAVEKRDLLRYLGNRIAVVLDDHSTLKGKLVSLSAAGNLILTGVERERPLKRGRVADGVRPVERTCCDTVLFVRGASVMTVSYTPGVTTDKSVVDVNGGRAEDSASSRTIQIMGISPSVPL